MWFQPPSLRCLMMAALANQPAAETSPHQREGKESIPLFNSSSLHAYHVLHAPLPARGSGENKIGGRRTDRTCVRHFHIRSPWHLYSSPGRTRASRGRHDLPRVLGRYTFEPKMKARVLVLECRPSFHTLLWSLQDRTFVCCVYTCCVKLGWIQDVDSIACRHVCSKGVLY